MKKVKKSGWRLFNIGGRINGEISKKTKVVLFAVIIALVLLFPIRDSYWDGGTVTYTSLTYKIIKWNTLAGKNNTEIYFFPNNFKTLDKYYDEYVQYNDYKLEVSETRQCDGIAKFYYGEIDVNIYTYCLDKIDFGGASLKENLISKNITVFMAIDLIVKNMNKENFAYDGGAIIYSDDGVKIIRCNTFAGNHDVYIGSDNMELEESFCKFNDLTLTSNNNVYNMSDGGISFVIENKTDKIFYTHADPILEFKTDYGFVVLEKNGMAGFCGNKDLIEDSIEMVLLLDWYDNLKVGDYRISFGIYNSYENDRRVQYVSKEFSLE